METPKGSNFGIYLASRPGKSAPPVEENFSYRECESPPVSLAGSEVVIRTIFLSVDPALRCCMNEDTGVDYLIPWQINEIINGCGGIGQIEAVGHDVKKFQVGDIVTNETLFWPWQLYFCVEQYGLTKVPDSLNHSQVLSCHGLIGLTVLLGIRQKGGLDVYPEDSKRPLTFVVSGAAGACGILAGQIAKLEGAQKTVGICGSDEKCRILTEEIGYDVAINYKAENVEERLKETCPDGIWSYFDNVGGNVSEAVVSNMNNDGHIILCGQISQYNKDVGYPPPISPRMRDMLEEKGIHRDRFLVLNYMHLFATYLSQLEEWMLESKLKLKETVTEGLENTGKAFVGMMEGHNIGKQIVKVSDTVLH